MGERKMLRSIGAALVAVAAGAAGEVQAAAVTFTLPDPSTVPVASYGDFYSYSFPVLNFINPGSFPSVQGNPGSVREDYIVVGTGAGGNYNQNFPGAAPKLDFPGGNPSITTFSNATTWTLTLQQLSSFVGAGNGFAVIFNNNQQGNDVGQSMSAWAQIRLVDTNGQLNTKYFELNNDSSGPLAYTQTLPKADPGATDWVLVPGEMCIQNGAPYNTQLPVNGSCPAGYTKESQNLGQSTSEFAVVSPELNEILNQVNFGGYDEIQVFIDFKDLTDGYETAYIAPLQLSRTQVPEPSMMAVFGTAFLGAGVWMRRRKTRALN